MHVEELGDGVEALGQELVVGRRRAVVGSKGRGAAGRGIECAADG